MFHVGKLMFCVAKHKFPDVIHKLLDAVQHFNLVQKTFTSNTKNIST